MTRHYRVNPTNCGERRCTIPAGNQEGRGEPQRLRRDVSATRLPGGLDTTLKVLRTVLIKQIIHLVTQSNRLNTVKS